MERYSTESGADRTRRCLSRSISYNRWMIRFDDKVALITGGTSGIGQGAAEKLAGLGAKVAVAGRNRQALDEIVAGVRKVGGQALPLECDVTESRQVDRAVAATVERFGRLDILLCSAGLSLRAYFETTCLDALERVMRVNFFGTLYATHFALPHIIRAKGSLVALSSLTGKRGIPSYALYGASKFAIGGLYESLRLEVARHGVHVGVVSPAFVATPLRVNVLAADGKPWPEPPPPPFKVWPVDKCVERIVRLIHKRQAEAIIPWRAKPLLLMDEVFGRQIGDRLLKRNFPPEANRPNDDKT
jgi:dehydrogenase/reductase SDR family protein 7B